jgi:hypothetical protein
MKYTGTHKSDVTTHRYVQGKLVVSFVQAMELLRVAARPVTLVFRRPPVTQLRDGPGPPGVVKLP